MAAKVYKGAKSDKIWREAIMRAVNRLSTDRKTKHLDILAHRLIKAGADGDVSALREIGDRLDGKPTISVDGQIGGTIQFIMQNRPEKT